MRIPQFRYTRKAREISEYLRANLEQVRSDFFRLVYQVDDVTIVFVKEDDGHIVHSCSVKDDWFGDVSYYGPLKDTSSLGHYSDVLAAIMMVEGWTSLRVGECRWILTHEDFELDSAMKEDSRSDGSLWMRLIEMTRKAKDGVFSKTS